MKLKATITAVALIAAGAQAFFFDTQNVYIEASDDRAYEFYVNGKFIGSGKRVHYTTQKDQYCKLEISAQVGDQIFGFEQVGKGWKRDERGFVGNLFHDMMFDSEADKGCPEDVVIRINPSAFLDLNMPDIKPKTRWDVSPKDKDFLKPKKTPSPNDWENSPYSK